jgi:hypothetical protein
MGDSVVLHLAEDLLVDEVPPRDGRGDNLAAGKRSGDALGESAGVLRLGGLKQRGVNL